MNEERARELKSLMQTLFKCVYTVDVYAHTSAVIMIPDNSSCSDELNKMKYNELYYGEFVIYFVGPRK